MTVGMMTTGYDCTDILNLGLFRPIFSPTDFVQIKGRGTRKHSFLDQLRGSRADYDIAKPDKTTFKLFDFFGNCEYFETEFNYDQVLKLPLRRRREPTNEGDDSGPIFIDGYEYSGPDVLAEISESPIGPEGMKIDRMLFDRFASDVRDHEAIRTAAEAGQWDLVTDRVIREVFNKPEEFYTLERLRKAISVDCRVTVREFVERALGLIPKFKSRDELLEEEFDKFIADQEPPGPAALPAVKMYFKAYVTSDHVRGMIDSGQFAMLATHAGFSIADYRAVPQKYRTLVREYVKDYVSLNLYAEAITRMPENPGIPPLFRSIFNNAYLPYRDPETLRAFLKTIDEFSYDHSERLGDAFEYLLSVLGSQGDAGQFRTPRHIIDFIVEIIDPKKDETILDPACGTAGFLISSYRHILASNTDADGNSTLTPDDKGRLAGNFKGYDISPDMVRLSLVNMYLHGFVSPSIFEYDTLTSEERWDEFADVILANPPFMSPKGGIRPHNRFSITSKRSEVLFLDYIIEHLNPRGRAAGDCA